MIFILKETEWLDFGDERITYVFPKFCGIKYVVKVVSCFDRINAEHLLKYYVIDHGKKLVIRFRKMQNQNREYLILEH